MNESANVLSQKHCKPCEGEEKPLEREEVSSRLREIEGWETDGEARSLSREFTMKDFMQCVSLIGRIAPIAESENHHPDLHLTGYKKLKVVLSTHAIGGLSENDFILAAKINAISMEGNKSGFVANG
jgi:4a-hydroxytetrahydrobiopterin dehydratase